jgi:hypothetical protein
MPKVPSETVYAVKVARWEEWQRMAEKLPRGRHILSVELLRKSLEETAAVITAVNNGKLVQYEFLADASGRNVRSVVKQVGATGIHRPGVADVPPRLEAAAMTPPPPPPPDTGDGSPVANGIALGGPPPQEDPHPGAIALGESLLGDTFNLGEHAVDDTSTPPA